MSDLKPLSEDWLARLIEVTADRPAAGGLCGVVTVTVPRKKLTLVFADGKVIGSQDEAVETVLPFTGKQYDAWLAGDFGLSTNYTKGDLRATGPTGPLLAALEVFDDPAVPSALA